MFDFGAKCTTGRAAHVKKKYFFYCLGGGSSLLAQPSASLQRLVGCGAWTDGAVPVSAFEPPRLDAEALMRRPTLTFLLARRDLHAYRQKMDAAVRINTVRQYAFEVSVRVTTEPYSFEIKLLCNGPRSPSDRFAVIVCLI